ncbi:hypothetical protein ACJMK2_041817 [Sinanodonta woodiana]|uniref:Uncharacterized protein n=1 Tax=Sinanodonta woodiana TaxID=1069815 RepID=A0ABD3W5D3_SINWO
MNVFCWCPLKSYDSYGKIQLQKASLSTSRGGSNQKKISLYHSCGGDSLHLFYTTVSFQQRSYDRDNSISIPEEAHGSTTVKNASITSNMLCSRQEVSLLTAC